MSLSVVSKDGVLLTSDITEPFVRTLSTLGDGVVMEKAAENLREAFRRIANGEADEATVSMSIKVRKSKDDPQLFTMHSKTDIKSPIKTYSDCTFVTENYVPERNRTEKTLYHTRG